MTKVKFVSKIGNILLAIMLFASLLLFSACDTFGPDDKDSSGVPLNPTLKIVYRPYSTSKVSILSNDTYIDTIYNSILEVSEDVLTEVVGQYGMGTISTGLLASRSPSTNGRDYETMFGISGANVVLGYNNQKIGEDMGRMTHVNYTAYGVGDLTYNALVLSYGLNPSVLEILKKILIPVEGDPPLVILGTVKDTNIYRIEAAGVVYYAFIGGQVLGMNGENLNFVPNGDDFSGTQTYLRHILGCNYGVIEKDYIGGELLSEGNTIPLKFQHWNYSVAEGDIENNLPASGDGTFVATGMPYLDAYLNKFGLTFAVEIAKSMLVGEGELPTEVICPQDLLSGDKQIAHSGGVVNLKSLYEKAKSGDDADKQTFIWAASAFVDHLGLTKDDISFIASQLKSVIIGETVYNASEGTNILKNNYDTYLFAIGTESAGNGAETPPSALQNALDQNPTKAVLEWTTVDDCSFVENFEVPGYLQSMIFMSKGQLKVDSIVIQATFDENAVIDYALLTRAGSDDGQTVTSNFFPNVNEGLLNNKIIEISDISEYFSVNILSNKKDPLLGSASTLNSPLNLDAYKAFDTDKDMFEGYHGWFFNHQTNFMELVFASKDVFSLTKIGFKACSFNCLKNI